MALTSEQAREMQARPKITREEEQRMIRMWADGAANSEVHAEFPQYAPGTINNRKTKVQGQIADLCRQRAVEFADIPNTRKPVRIWLTSSAGSDSP